MFIYLSLRIIVERRVLIWIFKNKYDGSILCSSFLGLVLQKWLGIKYFIGFKIFFFDLVELRLIDGNYNSLFKVYDWLLL